MLRPRANTFFRPNQGIEFTIKNLSGELNTHDPDLDIQDNQLSGGQNMTLSRTSNSSLKKRGGISLYRQFLGSTTGILAGYNSLGRDGTQDVLVAYDTSLYRDDGTNYTALTSVTLTTNLKGESSYYPYLNKTYYINATDNVVKYTPGATSGDQSDSSFKKGKYIRHYKNRLLVSGVTGQENYVWYTDVSVDTFSSNNYFIVDGQVTGIEVLNTKVLVFTKNKIFRIENFLFDGIATNPVGDLIPTSFGSIYQRTICVVNNLAYFLGQDTANKGAIYVTDGYQAQPLSDSTISSTLNGLNPSQFVNACACRDGFNYRLQVANSGKSTNTVGIIYDTVRKYFYLTENRFIEGRADFAVLWSSEINGQWDVYGGTQGNGKVYKLNSNDGLFDELDEERYLTQGSYNVAIDANPAKRAAQSFKMTQYNASQTVNITKLALLLKKNTGTTTDLTVRIETDNAGAPSGTLITNGSVTLSAFSTGSYGWKTLTFSNPVTLTGNTTYWLVVQHVVEGSGNSQYFWLGDSCTATYTSGNLANYTSGTWTADVLTDQTFVIWDQAPIDGYFDTKAWLPTEGKEYQLERFESIFNTVGSYFAEVSFSAGDFSTFTTYNVDLTGTGSSLYGTAVYGVNIYGGTEARTYGWTEVDSFVGRTLKMRIRNRNANQQVEFNRTTLELSPRLSQT